MLRPRLRIAARPRLCVPVVQSPLQSLAQQARSNHTLPVLHYLEKGNVANNGIPGFLGPAAFNIAWTQYQSYQLMRLNALTAETDHAAKHVKDILLATARNPGDDAVIFNHASMIHNNHFFFKHLALEHVKMPEPLRSHLEKSFGTIDTLRDEMIKIASAMFGPGFVWLVKTSLPGLPVAFKILTTYLAGSPYPAAHWRRQPTDMNTESGSWNEKGIKTGRGYLDNSSYGAGKRTQAQAKRHEFAPGGTDLHPVLCLNTWEHVWLWDYGFGEGQGGGKVAYAEKWWNRIDWELVQKEANIQRLEMSSNTSAAAAAAAAASN